MHELHKTLCRHTLITIPSYENEFFDLEQEEKKMLTYETRELRPHVTLGLSFITSQNTSANIFVSRKIV